MHNSLPGEIRRSSKNMKLPILLLFSALLAAPARAASAPTVAEAEKFMAQAEDHLRDLSIKAARATWTEENFINDDTEVMAADAQDQLAAATTELIEQAKRFDGLK